MTNPLSPLLRRLAAFTAAELTVFSFLIASLIGGTLLYFTEAHRTVTVRVPVHQEVLIQTVGNALPTAQPINDRRELHTVTVERQQQGETFIDAIFTAVSALCVTGLTSTDFSQFSLAGQIITLILIQMGGLGIIVFTSIFAFAVFRGFSEHLTFRKMLAGIVDIEHHYVRRMIRHVAIYTFAIEGISALVLGTRLAFFIDPSQYNHLNPWWWGLFHSVSAFNNAGFGLQPTNLVTFANDWVVNLTIMALIILGGLGYPVFIAFHAWIMSRWSHRTGYDKKLFAEDAALVASPIQLRIAVWGTLSLIALGTLFPLLVEQQNPALGNTFSQRLLASAFQSVSTRTAGFNTIDIGALHVSTLLLYMILMFIGANPAGTAGGVKIPTIAALYGYIKDWFRAPGLPVMLFGRRLSKFAVSHAIRLFFFSIFYVFGAALIITVFERRWLITPDPTINFIKVMFETFSAFGTVGLSMGFPGGVTSLSAIFSTGSKIVMILTMLVGRLGPLTLLAALPWKREFADAPLTPDHDDAVRVQIG